MYDKNPMLAVLNTTLDDIKALNVTVIPVAHQTAVTDTMIICTGRSSRHVRAIAQSAMDCMKSAGLPSLSNTGLLTGEWALVDFGSMVLHVMQEECRDRYQLESLWQSNK